MQHYLGPRLLVTRKGETESPECRNRIRTGTKASAQKKKASTSDYICKGETMAHTAALLKFEASELQIRT